MPSIEIEGKKTIEIEWGDRLRNALIENDLSPHELAFTGLNCGGKGICGTCRVEVFENGSYWEKRACQVRCFENIKIRFLDKKA